MYFSAPVQSQVLRTSNLKYLQTGAFFESSKCGFWISHPKKLTHAKSEDERMTRTIVITENVNSKWQILSRNTHFGQIFKSQ